MCDARQPCLDSSGYRPCPKATILQYVCMIKKAIRDLSRCEMNSRRGISRYIDSRYGMQNDCILKYVLNWMVCRKLLRKNCDGLYVMRCKKKIIKEQPLGCVKVCKRACQVKYIERCPFSQCSDKRCPWKPRVKECKKVRKKVRRCEEECCCERCKLVCPPKRKKRKVCQKRCCNRRPRLKKCFDPCCKTCKPIRRCEKDCCCSRCPPLPKYRPCKKRKKRRCCSLDVYPPSCGYNDDDDDDLNQISNVKRRNEDHSRDDNDESQCGLRLSKGVEGKEYSAREIEDKLIASIAQKTNERSFFNHRSSKFINPTVKDCIGDILDPLHDDDVDGDYEE